MNLWMNLCDNKHCITSKRLPVVICCDNRIKDFEREELINLLIEKIINSISDDSKLSNSIDLAFVSAEADINSCNSSDSSSLFNPVSSFRKYKCVCFLSLSEAITYSYDMIVERTNAYKECEIAYYPPMVVIIGVRDIPGDDTLQNDVIERISNCCNPENNNLSNIIIPVVFAVGKGPFENLHKCTLNHLNAGFYIDKSNISRVQFKHLVQPIFAARSLHLITKEIVLKEYKENFEYFRNLLTTDDVCSPSTVIESIKKDMENLLKDLIGD